MPNRFSKPSLGLFRLGDRLEEQDLVLVKRLLKVALGAYCLWPGESGGGGGELW